MNPVVYGAEHVLAVVGGLALILLMLSDGFETVVLTRTVNRKWRLTGLFYLATRPPIYKFLRAMVNGKRRNAILTAYPPISLISLVVLWAFGLITGFALLQYGLQVPLSGITRSIPTYIYFSGVTFLTLGYGDVVPGTLLGRGVAIAEAATGFFFLALVITYLPVFYSAIQRREVMITQLDVRAGSIPSGHQLIYRYASYGNLPALASILREYEKWGAELLEAYLSYPMLCFYRSQHDDQSWLATATAILDGCALIEAGIDCDEPWLPELRMQAHATFAMLRHVLVDLAYILKLEPEFESETRVSKELYEWIHKDLTSIGVPLRDDEEAHQRLVDLREMYEPYAVGIGDEILMAVPGFGRAEQVKDNWQIAAWDGQSHGAAEDGDEVSTASEPNRK